jgi:hypothetical protein
MNIKKIDSSSTPHESKQNIRDINPNLIEQGEILFITRLDEIKSNYLNTAKDKANSSLFKNKLPTYRIKKLMKANPDVKVFYYYD